MMLSPLRVATKRLHVVLRNGLILKTGLLRTPTFLGIGSFPQGPQLHRLKPPAQLSLAWMENTLCFDTGSPGLLERKVGEDVSTE